MQILVNGLIHGGVYALLAVGFSLIFGVARIINLTYTALYMVAAFIIYALSQIAGLNPLLSIIVTVILVSFLGMFSYQIFIHPIREHATTVLITTVAMAMIFQELLLIFFGGHFRGLPSLVSGYYVLMGVRVPNQYFLTFIVVLIILGAVWLLLMKTKLGIAIRSVALDREVANLVGMNTSRIASITMLITSFMAAVAGVIVAPIFTIEPHMWLQPIVIILAIVVMGGLGSIKGSFIAAFIIAFAEISVVFLVPMGSFLKGAVSLTVMIIVLLIKPEGLFGVTFEGER